MQWLVLSSLDSGSIAAMKRIETPQTDRSWTQRRFDKMRTAMEFAINRPCRADDSYKHS
jgi:hypothetical protein